MMRLPDNVMDVQTQSPRGICLYHHKQWRGFFQYLVNQVRQDIVPVPYLAQFKKLVCVCKPGKMDQNPENFRQILDEFDTEKIPKKSVSEMVKEIYKSKLWNVENSHHRCKSVERLMYLLHCAVQHDFDFLTIEHPKTTNVKTTTTAEIKVEVDDFEPGCLGQIIGKRGKNLRDIEKKFDCKIILSPVAMHWRVGKFTAKVKHPVDNPAVLKDVSECLKETANRIVVKNKFFALKFQRYIKQRLENQANRPRKSKVSIYNMKEANTRMFERHSIASKKFSSKQEHVSKLEGSHCLNCLTDYTTKLFKEAKCKHHPGYKVKVVQSNDEKRKKCIRYKWTCCDTECDKSYTASDDHLESGCTLGLHNWRPERRQQKGEPKPKMKVFAPHMD